MDNALFVCLLGIGTVFVGLICIVIIVELMHAIVFRTSNGNANAKQANEATAETTVTTPASATIQNRQEIIAAVSAALAEELGTEISAIRILSFKKIN